MSGARKSHGVTDLDAGRRVLERPSGAAAAAAVEDALAGGLAVSLAGRCAVWAGDAAGSDPDDPDVHHRHVLVKPDGSVVVHGASGTAPVARFGPAGDLSVADAGGGLRLEAGDGTQRGRVAFERVSVLVTVPLDDGGLPEPPEDPHARLRERLLDDPGLVEPGFQPRATERETPAGPVDLFGRDAAGRAVVVEIKAHRAGPAAVGQLDRYVSALRRDLHADAEVRGVLVAPSATERTRRLLDERGFDLRLLPAAGESDGGGSRRDAS